MIFCLSFFPWHLSVLLGNRVLVFSPLCLQLKFWLKFSSGIKHLLLSPSAVSPLWYYHLYEQWSFLITFMLLKYLVCPLPRALSSLPDKLEISFLCPPAALACPPSHGMFITWTRKWDACWGLGLIFASCGLVSAAMDAQLQPVLFHQWGYGFVTYSLWGNEIVL